MFGFPGAMFCEFTCPFRPWNTRGMSQGSITGDHCNSELLSVLEQVMLRWTVSFRPAVLRACWIWQGTPKGFHVWLWCCGVLCSRIEHALTRPPKLCSEPLEDYLSMGIGNFQKVSKGIQDFKAVPWCRQVRPAQSCCFGTHWPGTDLDVLPQWCYRWIWFEVSSAECSGRGLRHRTSMLLMKHVQLCWSSYVWLIARSWFTPSSRLPIHKLYI